MNYKIAAVVVTYNRLELLKKCVDSLRNQTHKLNEIIVINNSSSDGTLEWLQEQKDLTVITQENSGSAGGQYTGIKTAYEKEYDWIWCFDDDCFVEKDALFKLIELNPDEKTVLNCTVLSLDQALAGRLAFALYDKKKNVLYRNIDDFKSDIIPSANFFNGTLLNRNVIEKVGLPLKVLFIRGEEYEYLLRIQFAGFRVLTIKASRVFHPSAEKIIFDNIFFRYEYLVLSPIKRYYTIRNLTFITRKYSVQRNITLLKIILLDILVMISKLKFSLVFIEIKGFISGLLLEE
ncbi:MAG: glycosyltransferase family 2 protein [Candidatus Lokiarchaeota archaeon]|nr:glycosyltransferase family 2 protein [Candidatus Lokiarchaeota archaeon]